MPEHAEGRVLWEALALSNPPNTQPYAQLLAARESLLGEFRALKSEYANQAIQPEEFEARQMELRRLAEQNTLKTREESKRLRYASGRDF